METEFPTLTDRDVTDPHSKRICLLRISIGPVVMIGYSLIFWNRIHMNMQAGGGLSFRLSGEAGKTVEPIAIAGIGLGIRF